MSFAGDVFCLKMNRAVFSLTDRAISKRIADIIELITGVGSVYAVTVILKKRIGNSDGRIADTADIELDAVLKPGKSIISKNNIIIYASGVELKPNVFAVSSGVIKRTVFNAGACYGGQS